MQIKMLLALAFPLVLFSQAQEKPQPAPDVVTKIIHVRGDPGTIVTLVRPGAVVDVQGDRGLRVIVAKGKAADVASVERIIRELDSIGETDSRTKNVELVVYVLHGSIETVNEQPGVEVTALASVYKQLHAVFPFKTYRLMSTMLMRSGQNSFTSTAGMMRSLITLPDFSLPTIYNIQYDGATISGNVPPVIHLAKFRFSAKVPYVSGNVKMNMPQLQQNDIGIQTDLDLQEGQKIVVGTSNVEPAGSTLFVVVTAMIL